MGNSILIGTGVFVVIMVLLGLKKGLIRMAFSLLSIVIILVLINILTPVTKQILKKTSAYDSVNQNIQQYVEEKVDSITAEEKIIQTGTGNQEAIIDKLPLPNSIKTDLKDNNQDYNFMKVDGIVGYIASYLSDLVLNAVTFVLLFVILSILVFILIRVLDLFAKLPVIHFFNTAGGALMGLFEALVILWILCIIITACSTTDWGQATCKAISENGILSFIYDHNPLK